jgi:hypothetical protein
MGRNLFLNMLISMMVSQADALELRPERDGPGKGAGFRREKRGPEESPGPPVYGSLRKRATGWA